FEAPTLMALLSKHLLENAAPPSQRRRDLAIPPWIDELIMTAMAKDAASRYPTMEVFGERIAGALAALPPDGPSQQRSAVGPVAPTMPVSTPQHQYAGGHMQQATPQQMGGFAGAQTPLPSPPVPTPPPPGGNYGAPGFGTGTPSTPVPTPGPMPPMPGQMG